MDNMNGNLNFNNSYNQHHINILQLEQSKAHAKKLVKLCPLASMVNISPCCITVFLHYVDIISSKICDHIDLMSSNNNSESLKEVNISCKRSITGDTKDVETIYSIQLNEISSKAASELSTATHNKLPDIKFMLNINYFTFLDISNNCIPHNIANGLAVALSSCIYLNLLNISHNSLSFNCILEIVQVLRDCRNLQTLNLSYNIKSFVSEAEVLVDIILSVSSSLTCLNVCGRNIRPRFTGDYLSPPPGNKSSNRFLLHKLYLSQFISMYDVVFKSKVVVIPQNFKHNTEECPMQDKNTVVSYYVNHSGGTFYNQNHDFAIVVPPGAVLQDDGAVEIQATASYKCFKYYQFPNGYFPVSSIFWFSADYKFKIPVYLIMSHHARTKDLKDLCLTQACVRDLTISNDGKLVMKEVTDRVYTDNKIGYSLFITDHYCSLCLQSKRKELPNRFSGLFYTYDYKNNFIADLCFFPSNSDCRKVRMYVLDVC